MQEIKSYVSERKEIIKNELIKYKRIPHFVIVQVGNNEASNRYVRNKIKDCNEVGITTQLIKFNENVTQEELLGQIKSLNKDSKVTAYMVQFPLPKHISEEVVAQSISSEKDADGFTNNGVVNPCTPQGIISYLERQGYDFENKNALVIGRSNIVGKPMARLLLERNCNVTIIHSKTSYQNKHEYVENADLIICATGHENTLTNEFCYKKDAIIFDVGINFNNKGKLVGDCGQILDSQVWQSPVPGGVGLLTRLQLLENIQKLFLNKK